MSGRREHEFAGDPRSAAAARAFAKTALADLADGPLPAGFCDDVELVVSELVTNAVRAGSATVRLSVEHSDQTVTIRVVDQAGGWPARRTSNPRDINGRGLPLVSAVSRSWGVRAVDVGKVVWAELAVPV